MPVTIELETPLADALTSAIQPKLEQYGFATGGADDAALTEYIILMLVNGKNQEEVAGELSTDLLGIDPNEPGLLEFSAWLFSTIDTLSVQFGASNTQDVPTGVAQGEPFPADGDQDMDMSIASDGPGDINVYVQENRRPQTINTDISITGPQVPKRCAPVLTEAGGSGWWAN